MKQKFRPLTLIIVLLAACGRPADQAQTTYETVAVSKRDIRVAVEAAGQIEPALTVELKSKASGQILELKAETGQLVRPARCWCRSTSATPRNSLAQAQAQLEAAKARRSIAVAQNQRSAKLLAEKILNDVEYEQSELELANAKADVVRSRCRGGNCPDSAR